MTSTSESYDCVHRNADNATRTRRGITSFDAREVDQHERSCNSSCLGEPHDIIWPLNARSTSDEAERQQWSLQHRWCSLESGGGTSLDQPREGKPRCHWKFARCKGGIVESSTPYYAKQALLAPALRISSLQL